jgi:hypothetical protein
MLATAVLITAALLVPTAASGATSDRFAGDWWSIDVGDGSYQTLAVSGSGRGGHHGTRLYDTVASQACGGQPAAVQGPGFVSGDQMLVFFTVTCPGSGPGPFHGLAGPIVYTYHAATDTLTDDAGDVWHRLS